MSRRSSAPARTGCRLTFAVGGVAVGLALGLTQWQWRLLYPR